MLLIKRIQQDQIAARKDRNTAAATTLTTLLGEASIVGKNDGNRESTDAEVQAVITKFIKNNKEMIALGVKEAVDENELLSIYIPEQMSTDELEHIIADIIGAHSLTSPKDMGVIMKELKQNKAGLFDGKTASIIAKEQLSR